MDDSRTTNQDETPVKPPLPPGRKQWHRKHQGRIHFRKVEHPYPMEMIQQGMAALSAIHEHRWLTGAQIARLLFLNQPNQQGNRRGIAAAHKAANEMCLRRLKDAGYVECLPIFRHTIVGTFVRSEVNILTRDGVRTLQEYYANLGVAYRPEYNPDLKKFANQTLNHELAINDVAVAAKAAARDHGYLVPYWQDDAQLASAMKRSNGPRFGNFCPDAAFVVEVNDQGYLHFVEVDRGTESVRGAAPNTWEKKMLKYADYFQQRFDADPYFQGSVKPIVLTVTTSAERLKNLKEATEAVRNKNRYWFTTRDQLEPPHSLFDAIWQRANEQGVYSLLDKHFGL